MRPGALVLLVVLTACKPSSSDPAPPIDAAAAPLDAAPSARPVEKDATAPRPSASASAAPKEVVAPPTDAGPAACRLVWGPAEQPFHGPGELAVSGSELRVVINEDGKPRVFPIAITPPPKAPAAAPPPPDSFATARWPTCAVGGKWAFCPAKSGALTRTTIGASDTKDIAKAHPNTRVAAAALGADHAVVAHLETHKTSEGDMLQAFVSLEDGPSVRLSDDGAGGNLVHLVPRGAGVTAVYIDLRSSMLPVHARTITYADKLVLGADVLPFVGGPPERNVDFTVATVKDKAFLLVPMPRESTEFGVATVALSDPPKADVGASWTLYPNGLDPAPIAAAGPFVVRLRPLDAKPGSSRVLELGRVDEAGAFTSYGLVAEGARLVHVTMATDAHGSVWILYTEPGHTWLERRVCP